MKKLQFSEIHQMFLSGMKNIFFQTRLYNLEIKNIFYKIIFFMIRSKFQLIINIIRNQKKYEKVNKIDFSNRPDLNFPCL